MAKIEILSPYEGESFEVGDMVPLIAFVYDLSESDEEKDYEVQFNFDYLPNKHGGEAFFDRTSLGSDFMAESRLDSDNINAGEMTVKAYLYEIKEDGTERRRATSDEITFVIVPTFPDTFSGWAYDVSPGVEFDTQSQTDDGSIICSPLPAWNWNEYVDVVEQVYVYLSYFKREDEKVEPMNGLGKKSRYLVEEGDDMTRGPVNNMIELISGDWGKDFITPLYETGTIDIRLFTIPHKGKIEADTFIRLERCINYLIERYV